MSSRKKDNYRSLKIVAFLLCVLAIGTLVYFLKDSTLFSNNSNNNEDKPKEPVIKEEVYNASLIAVGDNLIHSSLYKNAYELGNYREYDFKPMYKYIKEIVSNYDIGYYNQETILGGTSLGLSNYPTFNSPFEVGDAMIDAGFNLVSLATNHTVDRGKNAVLKSCEYWNGQEYVITSGSYCSTEERDEVRIGEVNNITYTMLNYTYGTNGMPVVNDYLVNVWPTNTSAINNPDRDTKYQEYKNVVKADIEKVRDKVDLLIVAMHWGVEYTHEPTAYEKDMANYLASLGVDVIIGTHPHVIQPVTWIDDTLVIYSLGNFISAQYQDNASAGCGYYKCMVGLMTNFNIEKVVKGEEVKVSIKDVENELIFNSYNKNTWRGFVVIPFSHPEIKNKLPNYIDVYNTYKSVVTKMDDGMVVKDVYKDA